MGHGKREDMVVWQEAPYNAEPPPVSLTDPITANDAFYVRGHGDVPEIDPAEYHLSVDGLVKREMSLHLETLREAFAHWTETVSLQCAGNRRGEMMAVRDIDGEIPWGSRVIGTAKWTGARLCDVLDQAGVADDATHVEFMGAERVDGHDGFGASIPLIKARSPEVLLVWEMNGEPLPKVHGGPLRVIVPGYIGARSVKWLKRISLIDGPSVNHFQMVAYRLHPPGVDAAAAEPITGMPLHELGVNSAILSPEDGAELPAGPVEISGYAMTGGDSQVARVDVSLDGGTTWETAMLGPDQGRWAWRLWSLETELDPGPYEIVARTLDTAANTQPERVEPLWNCQGYANNAWPRATVLAR